MPSDHEVDPLKLIRELAADAKQRCDGIMELVNRALLGSNPHGATDMTDNNIADSVDFLRFFIDAAPILAIELLPNVNDPIMIRTTKALETIFEYAPGQLNGQPISVLIPRDKQPAHQQHILGFLQHPTDRQMGAEVKPEGVTLSGRRFPIVVIWRRFFVDTRQFLAATIMPQVRSPNDK